MTAPTEPQRKNRFNRRIDRMRTEAEKRAEREAKRRRSVKLDPEAMANLSWWQRRRLYRQHYKAFRRWRTRIIPKTTIGLITMIMAFSIGMAASGVVLYSWYQFRIDETNKRIDRFVVGFGERYETSIKTIDATRDNALADIDARIGSLNEAQTVGSRLEGVAQTVGPSVWLIATLGTNGEPSTGSAWVVFSDGEESYLVTSFTAVDAAARKPSPTVTLRKGEEVIEAQIWNTNPGRDLALLVIPRGGLPTLPLAPATARMGDRVFAVGGTGGLGASVTEGLIADVSAEGLQHTAPLSDLYRGGPLVDEEGRVVGLASRAYSPLNFFVDDVWFAPGTTNMCESTLACGDSGAAPGSAG